MPLPNGINLCGSGGVCPARQSDWSCVQVLSMPVSWNKDDVKHLWSPARGAKTQIAAFKTSYLIHITVRRSQPARDTGMSGNPAWTPDGRRSLQTLQPGPGNNV